MTIHAKTFGGAQEKLAQAAAVPVASPVEACGRIPAVTIHAFCESPALEAELERACSDHRMSRALVTRLTGGMKSAIAYYRDKPTPNLILLETLAETPALFEELDALSSVCDVSTKVILIGRSNDIEIYRALMRRGISEYVAAPVASAAIVASIGEVFRDADAAKVGRIYAFVGARGGAGSSTLAHNVAWTIGRFSDRSVILADMDLPFGTAALNFDLNPQATIAEAVREPERLDDQMLDRLLTPCGDNFSLLTAPAKLDLNDSGEISGIDALLDHAQSAASYVVVDVPHLWSDWTRRILVTAHEVVITATPDLASLRNTSNFLDVLRRARPHDPEPQVVLNQIGVPKRPEIKPNHFAEALGVEPLIRIPFDPKSFGLAANSGRMLPAVAKGDKYLPILQKLAQDLTRTPFPGRGRQRSLGRFFGKSAR